MNKFIFVGRVSSRPVFKEYKETLVTKFWLVRDDYVGKDQSGVAKTRQVFIPFSAFSSLAIIITTLIKQAMNDLIIIFKLGILNLVLRGGKNVRNSRLSIMKI